MIVTHLRQPRVRLLTVTGPGGSGKTRIAIAASSQVGRDFPDGIVFVDLGPISDPQLVAPTIARALGLRDMGLEPIEERLLRALAGMQTLLVLDNFEQVVAAAPLLTELLRHCSELKLLVTSRIRLRLTAEQEIPVGPLAVPSGRSSRNEGTETETAAVQLFIERAHAVQPDFTLDTSGLSDVAEIVQRLDGLPLAIELAAVRLRALSPASLLAHLEQRLPLLSGGARDVPARQKTMRDAIAWSYDLLSRDEQNLFRCLSVFSGSFSLPAAESISGSAENSILVLDTITALIDHSLLRLVGGTRYQLLETVREYAWEQLGASGERPAVQRRHASFCLTLAQDAELHLSGPDQAAWLDRLEDEHPNLRAALAWCRENEPEWGLRMGAALRTFWRVRGHLGEGATALERALANGAGSPQTRARALVALASIRNLQTDYVPAARLAAEARALSESIGDRRGVAEAIRRIAPMHLAAGLNTSPPDKRQFAIAEALWQEELTLRRELEDASGIAWAILNLGVPVLARGEVARAFRQFEEALPLLAAVGDEYGVACAFTNLGWAAAQQADVERAARLFSQALEKSRGLGDHWGMATILEHISWLLIGTGHVERATRLLAAAAAYREADGIGVLGVRHAGYEHEVATARSMLGETQFAAIIDAGRQLTFDEAVSEAFAALALLTGSMPTPEDGTSAPSAPSNAKPASNTIGLTRREEEVLQLLAEGLTNRQIAERIYLSPKTVSSHLVSLYAKLGVSTRSSAIRVALELGLLTDFRTGPRKPEQ